MPVTHTSSVDRLLDYVPDLMEKVNKMIDNYLNNNSEKEGSIIKKITTNMKTNSNNQDNKNSSTNVKIKQEEKIKKENEQATNIANSIKEQTTILKQNIDLNEPEVEEYVYKYDENQNEIEYEDE